MFDTRIYALDPVSVKLSVRLIRTQALLLPHLDPVKGVKAKALAVIVDELKELKDIAAPHTSTDLRQHLDVAISSLSTSSSTVPYVQCLDAQAAMVAALRLFASPLPTRPSPFFRLPSELVSHIVQFCQDEDLFVRQSTNLALSRTTRSLYRAVRPILRVEVHLFTAQQLERVSRNFKEHDFATSAIESLPVNLKLCQIRRRPDGRWAGRLLFPLLSQYRAKESARVLHINPAPSDSDGEIDEEEVFWQRQEEMMQALGFTADSFVDELCDWRFRMLEELEISFISGYSMYELVGFIADPPPFLQRLALGTGCEPRITHPRKFGRPCNVILLVRPNAA